jgi:hypothetical protein
MTNEEKIKVLRRIADADDSMSFYDDYSGRGMYGKECVAIDTYTPNDLIEKAAIRGVMGARVDQMGRGYVVYWPSIQATETEEN